MPTEESLTYSPLSSVPITLKRGMQYNITYKNAVLPVVEMEDVLFRSKSVVFMPNGSDGSSEKKAPQDDTGTAAQEAITGLDVLKTILLRLQEFPEQKILITGHTDTTGDDVSNQKLGYGRATSLQLALEGEMEDWASLALKTHNDKDVQHILEWASKTKGYNTDPQGVDGAIGKNTKDALERFYTAINTEFSTSFTPTRVVTTEFWNGAFLLYEDALQKLLDTDAAGLAQVRKSLRWMDDKHKSVGCGEYWPIDEASKNNYRSEANRRVEVYFFDKDESVALPCDPDAYPCPKDTCPIFPSSKIPRNYLPVHPGSHAQSSPVLTAPEMPGSSKKVNIDKLYMYVASFNAANGTRKSLLQYEMHNGKLCTVGSTTPVSVDCEVDVWLYFSHRTDLLYGGNDKEFKMDKSGLPLIGPIKFPGGKDATLDVDIWQQNDWVIVENVEVDGKRANDVLMAAWNDAYSIGYSGKTQDTNEPGFWSYGKYSDKDSKEFFDDPRSPLPLVTFCTSGGNPILVGTISKLPHKKCKLLLAYDKSGTIVYATSLNEIEPKGVNQQFKSHHTYNQELVKKLEAIDAEVSKNSIIDALPNPPSRCLLPGDMCWQNQGQTNFCGAYSFSTAMNYWFPYTYNPLEKEGKYCSDTKVVPAMFNGARTPANVETAAKNHNMNGVDRNNEDLEKSRAIKLIKLWIQAGVPVVFLVNEEPHSGIIDNIANSHWKTLVGWDGNRIFMNNSGGDREVLIRKRDPGIDYEHAPVGNDVDSEAAFYEKWSETSSLADLVTSVDHCTFIPIYPKDAKYASAKAT